MWRLLAAILAAGAAASTPLSSPPPSRSFRPPPPAPPPPAPASASPTPSAAPQSPPPPPPPAAAVLVRLDADARELRSGGVITLRYDAGAPPHDGAGDGDWLLLFSPADADPHTVAPIRAARAAGDAAYGRTGRGLRRLRLTNTRADVAVYFVRGAAPRDRWYAWMTGVEPADALRGGVLASDALVLRWADREEPLWPRVLPGDGVGGGAGGGDAHVLTVAWDGPAGCARPVVRWGAARGALTEEAPAVARTFRRAEMCGNTPWRDPRTGAAGTLHSLAAGIGFQTPPPVTYAAPLRGLAAHAGRTVWYSVGDGAHRSPEYPLRVPPPSGDTSTPFTLLVGADWGVGTGDDSAAWKPLSPGAINVSQGMAREVARGSAGGVLLVGDLSYSDGYLPLWQGFLDMTSPFSSSLPLLVAEGNHESGWPRDAPGASAAFADVITSGGECGVPLVSLYPQPPPWSAPTPWTWARMGPACVVVVGTEHPFAPGSPQHEWLDGTLATLAAARRGACPWLVAMTHRPAYINSIDASSPSRDASVMLAMQTHLDPLFRRHGVDVVVAGHNHRYSRACIVDAERRVCQQRSVPGVTEEGAPTAVYDRPPNALYVVAGASGGPHDYDQPGAYFVEREVMQTTGYLRLTLRNATVLDGEYVEVHTGRGEVVDRFRIVRGGHVAPGGEAGGGGGVSGGGGGGSSGAAAPSGQDDDRVPTPAADGEEPASVGVPPPRPDDDHEEARGEEAQSGGGAALQREDDAGTPAMGSGASASGEEEVERAGATPAAGDSADDDEEAGATEEEVEGVGAAADAAPGAGAEWGVVDALTADSKATDGNGDGDGAVAASIADGDGSWAGIIVLVAVGCAVGLFVYAQVGRRARWPGWNPSGTGGSGWRTGGGGAAPPRGWHGGASASGYERVYMVAAGSPSKPPTAALSVEGEMGGSLDLNA